MICLALECSTSRRSVAVARDGLVLHEAFHSEGRATPLNTLISSAYKSASLHNAQPDIIAVGLGPGSYTGIRVAIATVLGRSLAFPARLLGISSTDAIAHRAFRSGLRGHVAVVTDAHRGECYLAEFDLRADGPAPMVPLCIRSVAEIESRRAAGARIVGPELPTLGLTGDFVAADASAVAELAFHRTNFVSPESLEPIYLRPVTFVKAPRPAVS